MAGGFAEVPDRHGRRRLVYRGPRPGPQWHAHGTTVKRLWVVHRDRLVHVWVHKQRWKHAATHRTRHDRPPWDVPWSRSALDVVFLVAIAWQLGQVGLHRVDWPWTTDTPSRRTAQRWLAKLRADALAWQVAIRDALAHRLAPRPLEEILPTGGIPPPEGRARACQQTAYVARITGGLWLLENGARALSIPIRALLVEALTRWPGSVPIPG